MEPNGMTHRPTGPAGCGRRPLGSGNPGLTVAAPSRSAARRLLACGRRREALLVNGCLPPFARTGGRVSRGEPPRPGACVSDRDVRAGVSLFRPFGCGRALAPRVRQRLQHHRRLERDAARPGRAGGMEQSGCHCRSDPVPDGRVELDLGGPGLPSRLRLRRQWYPVWRRARWRCGPCRSGRHAAGYAGPLQMPGQAAVAANAADSVTPQMSEASADP